MNLNDWQKIDWVIPGKPFGHGGAGTGTISSDTNTRATLTGTAGLTTSVIGSAILSDGDVVLLHQTRGTNAGQKEFARVLSGGGTTSIVWSRPLTYTYTTGAQVIKFTMYNSVTVNSHSATSWNPATLLGGIEVICGRTTLTVAGALSVDGGSASSLTGGTGGGFYGASGFTSHSSPLTGLCGEGTSGPRDSQQEATNGNGAGGARVGADSGGGGGGNGLTGSQGNWNVGGHGGYGGDETGDAYLRSITFGGGGSSGCSDDSYGGAAGAGGGIIILISQNVVVSSTIHSNGGNGSAYGGDPFYSQACGGGGAGGSILIICGSATLGSGLITATGGVGGSQAFAQSGGSGAVGRIAVHYLIGYTGTTSPTLVANLDPKLKEIAGGAQVVM